MHPLAPLASARAVSLRYVDDSMPGIRRIASGKGFIYRRPDGSRVRDAKRLRRMRSIVIPPAWTHVWICLTPDGHIQATGRDARGRKQYRYHPRFREVRDQTKYARMLEFAKVLPKIRARVDADLGRPGLVREKLLATVVRLLEITLIRVGNEEYARQNASFGLTTLRTRHVDVHGSNVRFRFRGKSGIEREVEVHDRRVARVIARCSDLPGQILFQYLDDEGKRCTVESSEINAYLREISGDEFTAKDFRTRGGTVLAATAPHQRVLEHAADVSVTELKRNVVQSIKEVATRLGNTPAGWGCTLPRWQRPDWMVFDLDPDEDLAFSKVIDGAFELRDALETLKLESWVKTTGGKGLHVVVPIARRYDWETVRRVSETIAVLMTKAAPSRYVANMSKKVRVGKIFIDYLRNGEGATAILPYSARARPGLHVAMPVHWKDLRAIHPEEFDIVTVPKLLARRRVDPWADLLATKQTLPRALLHRTT